MLCRSALMSRCYVHYVPDSVIPYPLPTVSARVRLNVARDSHAHMRTERWHERYWVSRHTPGWPHTTLWCSMRWRLRQWSDVPAWHHSSIWTCTTRVDRWALECTPRACGHWFCKRIIRLVGRTGSMRDPALAIRTVPNHSVLRCSSRHLRLSWLRRRICYRQRPVQLDCSRHEVWTAVQLDHRIPGARPPSCTS